MSCEFANRIKHMQASEIREILKLTQKPEVISFAGGLPAPELFPTQEIAKLTQEIIAKDGIQVLQYATTEGWAPLRKKIAARMNNKLNTNVVADNILITTGSQQGLDFTGKLFLDEGDIVLLSPASAAWGMYDNFEIRGRDFKKKVRPHYCHCKSYDIQRIAEAHHRDKMH